MSIKEKAYNLIQSTNGLVELKDIEKLADSIKCKHETIYRQLRDLVKEGKVYKLDKWKNVIPIEDKTTAIIYWERINFKPTNPEYKKAELPERPPVTPHIPHEKPKIASLRRLKPKINNKPIDSDLDLKLKELMKTTEFGDYNRSKDINKAIKKKDENYKLMIIRQYEN